MPERPSLFRRFLLHLPHANVGFVTRYDLIKTRWGALYLHEFHRGDKDLCLHDHPWPFWTLILRGGYWEFVPDAFPVKAGDEVMRFTGGNKAVFRPPGYLGRYPATHAHRIVLGSGQEFGSLPRPWSLVWVGRKSRPWGFWTIDGWRAWVQGQGDPICETK